MRFNHKRYLKDSFLIERVSHQSKRPRIIATTFALMLARYAKRDA